MFVTTEQYDGRSVCVSSGKDDRKRYPRRVSETGWDEKAQAAAADSVRKAAAIMARLRGPDGCPWDREQTFDTIKKYTLEETYEVFDAIERRDWNDLRDELGDLLLQVLFYAQMAQEAGYFSLQDVAESLSAKLLRRHPHVFGDVAAADSDTVLRNWEAIKREEKLGKGVEERSLMDQIPRTMPATMEANKLGSKAAKVGFDWPDATGLFAKMEEELAELNVEVNANHRVNTEAEFGDLMFTAVNLARHLKVDTESALRGTNAKFRRRFAAMEDAAGGTSALEALSGDDKESLWASVKVAEHTNTGTAEERMESKG